MDIDLLMSYLGHFGIYQLYIFLISSVTVFVAGIVMLSTVFVSGPPEHRCFVPNCDSLSNKYSTEWLNFTIPKRPNSQLHYSQCQQYKSIGHNCAPNLFTSDQVECQKWIFDNSEFNTTTVTEWNLVCDDLWYLPLSQSTFMAGVLVGVFLFGSMADRFGRRKVFFFGPAIALIACLWGSYSSSFLIFTITSAVMAACVAGMYTVGFVILIEFITTKSRVWAANLQQTIFAVGELSLCLVAYYIRDWRQLQLAISFPIGFMILLPWLLPESIRWDASHGHQYKALKTINQAAKWNNVKIPNQYLYDQCSNPLTRTNSFDETSFGPLDILKHKTMRRWSINLFFNWIVNSLVFYGLSLQSSNLGTDTYTTFAWLSFVEIPGIILTTIVMSFFGRKPVLMTLLLLGGGSCILPIFIPEKYSTVSTWLAIFGKSNISGSFSLIYVYSVEIFPTVLRSTGLGMCSMFARLGGILAPHLIILKVFGETVPLLFCGVVSIVAGILVIDLPETRNKKLPDTLNDIELLKHQSSEFMMNDESMIYNHKLNDNDSNKKSTDALEERKKLLIVK